jgi:anti-sigma regulatory factor (Ser/Thr protein kinase)
MFPIDDELPPDPASLRGFLIRAVARQDTDFVAQAAQRFNVSRQAVNQQLRALVRSGVVEAVGATKGRRYTLFAVQDAKPFLRAGGPSEQEVWADYVAPKLRGLTSALSIAQYAFTEIYNNAIDHSDSPNVIVAVECSAAAITMAVIDTGIGIYNRLREMYQYADEQAAVLDLVKGRLTTDPERHSGWGIFYSSRMCDSFSISSGHTYFSHRPDIDADSDWLMEIAEPTPGTRVMMTVDTRPSRTLSTVLAEYSLPGKIGLNVTHVPLNLAQVGEERLVSRSQAKSVAARFDWFEAVVLDFKGVSEIGQAFADELFRVWQRQNPTVSLHPINAGDSILRLIAAARVALAAETPGSLVLPHPNLRVPGA